MVIADTFSGFCTESYSASGYHRPYLFMTGRSEALQGLGGLVPKDPLMSAEAYTCMSTLLRPFSSTLRGSQRGRRRDFDKDSNRSLFCDALHAQEFETSVLDSIGDQFKDTVERANGNKHATDIMQPSLRVAFCSTYGVGLTSDKKLMTACDPTAQEPLVERLAPRISGTGVFACKPMRTTSHLIAPAEVDVAINTVARSVLKEFAASAMCERAVYAMYVNELHSAEVQRDQLCYLLASLRGRIDTDKLISTVDTLSDNVGLQLDASVKINRTVLALTVNRDLDDAREPVTKSTVETTCLA
ncbi:hypothetical protein Q5P01_012001 [Channa striata]|uniref:Uncharacterized protein n=1 Tax=Channa striata TaxID=64152 RepID=A0AA88MR52_CHASR|nr:hypothetical protein Q5P01_012001 [Channa striata]